MKKILLNLSIEFGPIVAFLVASELTSFLKATLIFVLLTGLALIAGYIERRELAWFPLIVGISIIGFGMLTIIFKNPFFIIFKDTIYNGLFAVVLGTGLLYKKPLLKPLFKGLFSMSEKGWLILTFRWMVMFILITISNEIARMHLTPDDWVVYKGISTLATMAFSLYQFKLSRQERLPDSTQWGMRIIEQK
jgi:intracellular septation protein